MRSKVARVEDVPVDEMRPFYLDDSEVLIINEGGQFFGLAARCTHAGAPLSQGTHQGDVLTCPWHGSQFRITDGSVLHGPAEEPLPAYPIIIENGDIFVQF